MTPAVAEASVARPVRISIPALYPAAIADHARSADTRARLIASLETLDNDDVDLARIEKLRGDLHPQSWLDNAIIAHAAAELIKPRRALEIGVRRGFCSSAIVSANTNVEM